MIQKFHTDIQTPVSEQFLQRMAAMVRIHHRFLQLTSNVILNSRLQRDYARGKTGQEQFTFPLEDDIESLDSPDCAQTPTSTPSAPRVDAKQAEKANDAFWVGFEKYLKDRQATAKNTPGGWAGYGFSAFWMSFLD